MLLSLQKSEELPQIIRTIKQNFTKLVPLEYYPSEISESLKKRNEKGIWQRRYYDHVIRDEKDLFKHIDYIHYNSKSCRQSKEKILNFIPASKRTWNNCTTTFFAKEVCVKSDW